MRLPLIILCLLISLSLAAQLYSPFRFGMDGTDYLLPGAMAYTNSNNLSAAVNSAALDRSHAQANR
jgi:hypothetical protein